jgi:cobalamin synthase
VIVFAHAGHWLPQLLYLLPVVVLVGAILVGRWRERREGGRSGDAAGEDAGAPPSG